MNLLLAGQMRVDRLFLDFAMFSFDFCRGDSLDSAAPDDVDGTIKGSIAEEESSLVSGTERPLASFSLSA